MNKDELRLLIRNFALELAVYSILVVLYFLIVLRVLERPLTELFHDHRVLYAFIGLGLILGQGALLDAFTSFLLDRLELERLE